MLIYAVTAAAQQKETNAKITAEEIVQRAIDNAGGDKKLKAVKSAEFISQIITGDNDTLYFSVKRKGSDKYYISVMSFRYENTTTVFNNGNAVLIKNNTAERITDPIKLESLALNCYSSIDYGYKKLGYKLSRIEDLQFSNFNCYGVLAESPLGSKTVNYYDKETGNCIMIMYPSGSRTIFKSFLPYQGLLYGKDLLLSDAKGNISTSFLRDIKIDKNPDDNWFNLLPIGDCRPPAIFKTGRFQYVNGNDITAIMTREENKQIESDTEYKIEWLSDSDYLLHRLKYVSAPPINENIEYFKVRITSWRGNRYYCQYITSDNQAGTCAFEKIE
ncbi:hypothetical protein GCM10022209_15130 [Chitinophaga oryziterrae]